jgi:hypothetical protein
LMGSTFAVVSSVAIEALLGVSVVRAGGEVPALPSACILCTTDKW